MEQPTATRPFKVLGILQNAWSKDGGKRLTDFCEKMRADVAKTQGKEAGDRAVEHYRRRVLTYSLFAGCLTGRRLKQAFNGWHEKIVWENASPFIADHASGKFNADLEHMQRRIKEEDPHVIIVFGTVAKGGLTEEMTRGRHVIRAPHPACRQTAQGTMFDLITAAKKLELLYNRYNT